jgi:CRP-like cAMP-binding protein
VLMRALSKKPADRYGQWPDFADALLAVNRSMPVRRDQDREGERFAQLRALAFFKDFPDATLWEALRLGTICTFKPGDTLMKENTPGESFCIILEGSVAVTRHGRKLVSLGPGVTLGEMAYLQPDHPMRSAGAVAATDVVVLEIKNSGLRKASDELQTRFDRVFISLLVKRLIATTASLETLAAARG